jgi:dephospho-CoA kinase
MIIGLCGEKQSGKDTVAAYLIKHYEFERRAFADPLKRSVAALLGIPYHEVDLHKNDATVHISLGYHNTVVSEDAQAAFPHLSSWSPIVEPLTFRSFLQRYGTESHRDVFGEDFWVDQTLPINGYYPGRKIVLTDVRFENEAERVRQIGGSVVRIYRSQTLNKDSHPSENYDFPVDHILYNNDGLNELWNKVEMLLMLLGEQEKNGE